MQHSRRSLTIATSTPPTNGPLKSISDARSSAHLVHCAQCNSSLSGITPTIMNCCHTCHRDNYPAPQSWVVPGIGSFTSFQQANAAKMQRLSSSDYLRHMQAHWNAKMRRGDKYPGNMHTGGPHPVKHFAKKIATKLHRLFAAKKLRRVGQNRPKAATTPRRYGNWGVCINIVKSNAHVCKKCDFDFITTHKSIGYCDDCYQNQFINIDVPPNFIQ